MTRLWKQPRFWAAVAVALPYLVRAIAGVLGGGSYVLGASAADDGDFDRAAKHLQGATVGFDRFDALLLRAEVALSRYDQRTRSGASPGADAILAGAATDYLEAASRNPAGGLPWAGLGQVYLRAERAAYETRPVQANDEGWADVGRPGRIAVGMLRLASRRTPGVFTFHDQLAFQFLENGLRAEAIEEVKKTAAIQPFFGAHAWDLNRFPEDLLQAFATEARESLGHAPMLGRGQQLLSLGRVEHRLGHLDQAAADLKQALELPADFIHHAEYAHYLAQVEIDRGRYREAERALEESERFPTLRLGAMEMRATIAEKEGKPDEARRWLNEARRIDPGNAWLCIRFARLARAAKDWDAAIEALSWAGIRNPDDPAPLVELVETYLDQGDAAAADRTLEDLELRSGETADVRRLRSRLEGPRPGTQP